jgi:hypothetical protein
MNGEVRIQPAINRACCVVYKGGPWSVAGLPQVVYRHCGAAFSIRWIYPVFRPAVTSFF